MESSSVGAFLPVIGGQKRPRSCVLEIPCQEPGVAGALLSCSRLKNKIR